MSITDRRRILVRSRNCLAVCICLCLAQSYLTTGARGDDSNLFEGGSKRFAETRNQPRDDPQNPRLDVDNTLQNEPTDRSITLAQISRFLEKWKTAWENKNVEGLLGLYDPKYKVGHVDFRTLQNRKRAALNKYQTIEIQVRDIRIKREDDRTRIDFVQFFRGDDYSDKGTKTLYVTRDREGKLRILAEHWKPLEVTGSDSTFTESKSRTEVPRGQSTLAGRQDSATTSKSGRDELNSGENAGQSELPISEECASSVHKDKKCPELRLTLVKLLRKLRPLRRKALRSLELSEPEKNLLSDLELQEKCVRHSLNARCPSTPSR